MSREMLKRGLLVVGAIVLVWFLFVQNGGDTVTILNHSSKEICEVNFAFSPEENGWGRNKIRANIKYPHSRDIRMPLYFEWFAEDAEGGYSGRVVGCDGTVVDMQEGLGVDTNYELWEVR